MAQFLDLSICKRNPSFALLYSGQFISFLGTMLTVVALPYQMYASTHSTIMVGMLSGISLLPLLVTALLGGVFADRHSRHKILIMSEGMLALACISLALNNIFFQGNPWILLFIASFMSAILGLHRPSFEGLIQQIVSPGDYKTLGALRSFQFSFCMIVGPAIAGLLIAAFGVNITYLIDFFTFLCSLITLLLLQSVPNLQVKTHPPVWKALKEGVHFAFSNQILLGSYFVDFISMLMAMPNALFPALALQFGGTKTLGLLYAAPAEALCLFPFIVAGLPALIKTDKPLRTLLLGGELLLLDLVCFIITCMQAYSF